MNVMMLWITLLCGVLMIVAFGVTPFVTRKTELFGVSLPSSEIKRYELTALRQSYLRMTILAGAVMLALNVLLFLVFTNENVQIRLFMILIFGYVAVGFLIYLLFHKKMIAFKAAQPWRSYGRAAGEGDAEPVLVVDTSPPGREVVHPAWLWLYAVIGGVTLLYLKYIWPSLPDRIPMNLDTSGAVAEYIDKGTGAFFTMMLAQWIIIIVFILVYLMIPISKRQIDAARPLESREQGRRYRYNMSACMVFCGAALAAVVGILPIAMAQGNGGMAFVIWPLVFTAVIVVVMLAVMFRTGQGGSKLKVDAAEPAPGQKRMENTDDDLYWKLGVIYVNPTDPAVIVEKRFGIGWTLNFGRPVAWLFLAGIAALVIVTIAISYNAQ